MPKIVPSILEETKEAFDAKVFAITRITGVDRIQVDFGDGTFVSHRTVPISEIHPLNPAFHWEAHLMTKDPEDFLDYQIAGFGTIIIHYEAFNGNEVQIREALSKITKLGLTPGLALNPETDVSVAANFSQDAKQFTLLSVQPGYQGGEFLSESIERLQTLRKSLPNAIIEVDGGVTMGTIKPVSDTGVDLIVIGHAIFESDQVQENFDRLAKATLF